MSEFNSSRFTRCLSLIFLVGSVFCPPADADDYLRHEVGPETAHPAFLRQICEQHGLRVSFGRSAPDFATIWLQRQDGSVVSFSWTLCASALAARRMVEKSALMVAMIRRNGPRKGFGPTEAPANAPFAMPPRDGTLPGEFAQVINDSLCFARGASFVRVGMGGEALLRDIGLRFDEQIQRHRPEAFHALLDEIFFPSKPNAQKESETRRHDFDGLLAKMREPSRTEAFRADMVLRMAEIRLPQTYDLLSSLTGDASEAPTVRYVALSSLADLVPERALSRTYELFDEIDSRRASPESDENEKVRAELYSPVQLRYRALSLIAELENPEDALSFFETLDLEEETEEVRSLIEMHLSGLRRKIRQEQLQR